MTPRDLVAPLPFPATGPAELARIEEWAALRRAELSRLALAARSARMRAERAERDESAEVEEAPEQLLAVLDSMLDSATRAADRAVVAARSEAAATVSSAHERASVSLGALGLDPVAVLGAPDWTCSATADFALPVSAHDLWCDIEVQAGGGRPSVAGQVGGVPGSADAAPRRVPAWRSSEDLEVVLEDAQLFEAFWAEMEGRSSAREPERVDPGRPREAVTPSASWLGIEEPSEPPRSPEILSTGPGPTPGAGEDAELFEVFWRGPETELLWDDEHGPRRPLRERLRRRTARGR